MQIKIDMKILIFALIFYLTNQLNIYILLMIFACLHELGHLVLGRFLGFKPYIFEIKPIGFSVSFINPVEDYNKKIKKANLLELKKIFIYLAGPIVNVLLAIVIYFLNIDTVLILECVYINIILILVNFFPIYPLDGGRILKSILCIFCGLKKSYIITEKISLIVTILILFVSSIFVLKIHNIGFVIMVFYLVYVKIKETRVIEKKLEIYKLLEDKNL